MWSSLQGWMIFSHVILENFAMIKSKFQRLPLGKRIKFDCPRIILPFHILSSCFIDGTTVDNTHCVPDYPTTSNFDAYDDLPLPPRSPLYLLHTQFHTHTHTHTHTHIRKETEKGRRRANKHLGLF
mmetsp:Transcript_19367/g.30745  ORF Transcript_19367/g.30745 Transcript_19367/m.30745 type:complete len:126 (+) Transcript_19367:125-502(+)